MVDEKRKTTVPIPPVGADGEQPISNESTALYQEAKAKSIPPAKFLRKIFWNFKGSMTGSTIPPTSIP